MKIFNIPYYNNNTSYNLFILFLNINNNNKNEITLTIEESIMRYYVI